MTNEAPGVITIETLSAQLDWIQKTVGETQLQIKDCTEIIRRQNSMLDIAINLMASLSEDNDVPVNVKRRILFALQQIRGKANLS